LTGKLWWIALAVALTCLSCTDKGTDSEEFAPSPIASTLVALPLDNTAYKLYWITGDTTESYRAFYRGSDTAWLPWRFTYWAGHPDEALPARMDRRSELYGQELYARSKILPLPSNTSQRLEFKITWFRDGVWSQDSIWFECYQDTTYEYPLIHRLTPPDSATGLDPAPIFGPTRFDDAPPFGQRFLVQLYRDDRLVWMKREGVAVYFDSPFGDTYLESEAPTLGPGNYSWTLWPLTQHGVAYNPVTSHFTTNDSF